MDRNVSSEAADEAATLSEGECKCRNIVAQSGLGFMQFVEMINEWEKAGGVTGENLCLQLS